MTVAPRSREAFSAVRGLSGWVWGRDGCERATKGNLNMTTSLVMPRWDHDHFFPAGAWIRYADTETSST